MKSANFIIPVIIFSILLCSGNVSAQKGMLTIGPQFTADMYHVKFNPLVSNTAAHYAVDRGFSLGMVARYQIGSVIRLRAGFSTVKRYYGIKYEYSKFRLENDYVTVAETNTAAYNDYTIGAESFILNRERLKISVSGSFSIANLIGQKKRTDFNSQCYRTTNDLKSTPAQVMSSFPMSMAFQLSFCKNMQLIAEPYFRVYTGRLEQGITASNPVQYGLAVSLACSFQN